MYFGTEDNMIIICKPETSIFIGIVNGLNHTPKDFDVPVSVWKKLDKLNYEIIHLKLDTNLEPWTSCSPV